MVIGYVVLLINTKWGSKHPKAGKKREEVALLGGVAWLLLQGLK